ncbi:MAG: glutamate--tRNA ligase [Pseudanabaena sp. M135S2SP2A07QC]|jgi:glutamyl-tRNA synthetase|nr:glutamate--tRNA ligase [Pseudanabaena sp. M090S1SP2A07QC]MCA6519987.1 glutamate--tRNA ligase [Pseudanabaena sp. M110S1SP2A07QC]MCA6527685.1 glutamate--tRNA ligase [Pseudanabaena sp. M179S2SP2A07QC]MCA6531523.1 glutamate--tRNA ligase [Pseudanabaena sp. M125S2SP2A07QC]MCA6534609.1 glutamate--tRNA ligase [Pseudanabaena sp. M176S2SP2A07QC]MCA6547630.1 glutamate--tRNA ligase [Pseudanabaena sp. M152S2SP2A07QC]MCA6554475.1 glutamate--tRNA ligase [Pseudanabaena sp. M135S2SP2A07QC]MCA6566966.1 glu
MSVRVRIAPSPTGNLHIGTARTAVFNWLYARHNKGTFILRVEDTDRERSKDEYTQNILEGLAWLGIDFDEGPFFQTQRSDRYIATVQQLLAEKKAYFCYCTESELETMREMQKANKQAPRYDNRHRNLTDEQRQAFAAEGRRAVVRFIIEEPRTIAWNDLVRGTVSWSSSDLGGDMVIARVDEQGNIGLPLYNFAVVVDDIDMEITQVIRGEDHIANTAKQILIYEALGATPPQFGHTPLILNQQGAKISKRDGATSVWEFRNMGYIPEAFNNYMALLGWSPSNGKELFTLQEATEIFSFDRVNKAGAKFDWDKLNWINSQYLHSLPTEDVCDRLTPFLKEAGYELESVDQQWLLDLTKLIAPSLTLLTDAATISKFFFTEFEDYTDEAKATLQGDAIAGIITALIESLKETSELDADSAGEVIKTVMKSQGVKKGVVMKSLRASLTGDLHGPEILPTFVLLHRKGLALSRLQRALTL